MQSKQRIQNAAKAITSFVDSYRRNKEIKLYKQSESGSTTSLTYITSSLESLRDQIQNNNSCKLVIKIPNLLISLTQLASFKISKHISIQYDQYAFAVRFISRYCLYLIQLCGDASDQYELVRVGYAQMLTISFSEAGGSGEEQDVEIWRGLDNIFGFLRQFHKGRNDSGLPVFTPLPLLTQRSVEQIEEEGGNEELESQLINNRSEWDIKYQVELVKGLILNCYVDWINPRPWWHQ